jgi:hypothetical protein
MTFDQLVDRLVSLYDVGQSRAVDVANERLQRMVSESKSLRAIKSLGTTVASQTSYALDPTIVQVFKVKVAYTAGQINYEGMIAIEDLWDVDSGDAEVNDPDNAYWFAIEADSDSLWRPRTICASTPRRTRRGRRSRASSRSSPPRSPTAPPRPSRSPSTRTSSCWPARRRNCWTRRATRRRARSSRRSSRPGSRSSGRAPSLVVSGPGVTGSGSPATTCRSST